MKVSQSDSVRYSQTEVNAQISLLTEVDSSVEKFSLFGHLNNSLNGIKKISPEHHSENRL